MPLQPDKGFLNDIIYRNCDIVCLKIVAQPMKSLTNTKNVRVSELLIFYGLIFYNNKELLSIFFIK